MKLGGKLNSQKIKSIMHKCTSNYHEFLSKTNKFLSAYKETNITNNINYSIVSSHNICNYIYLLQKTVLALLMLF